MDHFTGYPKGETNKKNKKNKKIGENIFLLADSTNIRTVLVLRLLFPRAFLAPIDASTFYSATAFFARVPTWEFAFEYVVIPRTFGLEAAPACS